MSVWAAVTLTIFAIIVIVISAITLAFLYSIKNCDAVNAPSCSWVTGTEVANWILLAIGILLFFVGIYFWWAEYRMTPHRRCLQYGVTGMPYGSPYGGQYGPYIQPTAQPGIQVTAPVGAPVTVSE